MTFQETRENLKSDFESPAFPIYETELPNGTVVFEQTTYTSSNVWIVDEATGDILYSYENTF